MIDALSISGVDEQVVTYAYQWMPYNGSEDDQILVEFGLTPVQFYRRAVDILQARELRGPFAPAYERFKEYCHRRLHEHMAASYPKRNKRRVRE